MTQVEEYKKNMSELFSHWKRKKSEDGSINYSEQFFIEDGVIYPKQWFSQDIRPLYLLKEAHGWDKSGNLIDDHLMNTGKKLHRIWRNVCEWTEGIFETTKDYLPIYHETEYENNGNDILKKIAVINIKKSSGKSSSDMDEINNYALFDKEEIMREIALCNPTIIICGYTMSSLNIITDYTVKDEKHPDKDWIYSFELNEKYFNPPSEMGEQAKQRRCIEY